MAVKHVPLYTVEQYLEMEQESQEKHEYIAGEIFAMAGASVAHVRIAYDVGAMLANQLSGRPCKSFGSDLRVRTAPAGLYTYPDLSAACGEPVLDGQTLTNPILIIEVLSASTESYDRGEKFVQYQRIETLREYVLIYQDRPRINTYTRGKGAAWTYVPVEGLEATAHLHSIGCELPLAEVYRRVTFAEDRASAPGGIEVSDSGPLDCADFDISTTGRYTMRTLAVDDHRRDRAYEQFMAVSRIARSLVVFLAAASALVAASLASADRFSAIAVRLGNRVLRLDTPALRAADKVYAPVSVLDALGVRHRETAHDESVIMVAPVARGTRSAWRGPAIGP